MPYPAAESNTYLVEGNDGWSLIDVGIDTDATREVMRLALKEVGISFRHVKNIYITHCHPDHLGAAGWMQQQCDCPVHMLKEEIDRARDFIFLGPDFLRLYRDTAQKEFSRHGFPEYLQDRLVKDWQEAVNPFYPEPSELSPLYEGDMIYLGGRGFEVVKAPGHADGQYMLWCSDSAELFIADVLSNDNYLHITDWPNTHMENQLEELYRLMEWMGKIGEAKVFPGHGLPFRDLELNVKRLYKRHERILDKLEKLIVAPVTAGDIYEQVYSVTEYVHVHRIVIGETIAYLNHLFFQGRLERWQEGKRTLYGPRSA
jgi:glyoxylase-like metal-dependent hydrolase (beta-lactamase superfamily II)